ncbi:hypothetical protein LEN26_015339 [Aphanomyces euteiches]|nr:hypothetical protein LEN26_015339 [Aphanomyces euteiches]KAH9126964.1 hypothetical protein AeMF1_002738 [Aphanomyces euteiches]KAH9193089.1 hypothetical protein AeNC1_004944 [Aphanomyces euteiches]
MDFEELMHEVESAVQDKPSRKANNQIDYTKPTTATKAKSDIDELLDLVDSSSITSASSTTAKQTTQKSPAVTTTASKATTPASMTSKMATKRCVSVYLGGTQMNHGVNSSSVNAQACSNLRCNECDFTVVQFENQKWNDSVDYMFFRENVPNEQRLRVKMSKDTGTCAYACQCKWANVSTKCTPDSRQLKWCCAGH